MRDIQLFLRLLAEHVYAAQLSDSTDFKQWLLDQADRAGDCSTMEEFFRSLP